jgi:hypothetical protein
MTIRETIQKVVQNQIPIVSIAARVIEVRENEGVCDVQPLDGSAEIFDVLLNAEQTIDKGITIIPAVDSVVYVTFVNKNVAFVSLNSVIDKVLIKINDISLLIVDDEIVLNDGNNDGLVKVNDLVSKLNALENDINTLKNVFAAFVPVPADGGAALKVAAATWSSQLLTTTVKNDIENNKVKH